jgi:Bifunctional DNA primase/polymerase, N-terminal
LTETAELLAAIQCCSAKTSRLRKASKEIRPLDHPVQCGTSGGRHLREAEDRYVAVPPSIHPDGMPYAWLNDEAIVEAPSWLLVLARKPTPPQPSPPLQPRAPSAGRVGTYGAAALKSEIDVLAAIRSGINAGMAYPRGRRGGAR